MPFSVPDPTILQGSDLSPAFYHQGAMDGESPDFEVATFAGTFPGG